MAKCNFCGREDQDAKTKFVQGYEILEYCSDCEKEILSQEATENKIERGVLNA